MGPTTAELIGQEGLRQLGAFSLKGIEQEIRPFEVRWDHDSPHGVGRGGPGLTRPLALAAARITHSCRRAGRRSHPRNDFQSTPPSRAQRRMLLVFGILGTRRAILDLAWAIP
ncbi:MAG: hypothetical protein IPN91_07735 [Holophagaceae bacterium]|uniref:Uncharacterized protein n=1 Tax=Candidatus Geothrix odensensis TaxID=2954440 RepID=A0A936F2N9_9BACT|nr:hypothetical protein [Candidatus Geothrix odensensis]